MREVLTAISFLLVILAPTVLAARVSGVTLERKKKVVPKKPPQRVDEAMILLGKEKNASGEDEKRA